MRNHLTELLTAGNVHILARGEVHVQFVAFMELGINAFLPFLEARCLCSVELKAADKINEGTIATEQELLVLFHPQLLRCARYRGAGERRAVVVRAIIHAFKRSHVGPARNKAPLPVGVILREGRGDPQQRKQQVNGTHLAGPNV